MGKAKKLPVKTEKEKKGVTGVVLGIFFTIVGVLVSMFAFDYATSLINMQDSAAVFFGFALIVVLIIAWLIAFLKYYLPAIKRHCDPNHIASLAAVAVIGLSVANCSRVDPAHVGVEVDYYGKDRGVQNLTLVTGMVWYNPFTKSIFQYPTFVQTAVWTRSLAEGRAVNEEISYNSSEGLLFTADISLSYEVIPDKVPHFYVKFRSDDLNAFTHGFLRNIARDAFNEVAPNYKSDELYGAKKEEILLKVRERLNKQTEEFGIRIVQFGYVGAPRPPGPVVEAINNKVKAIQDAIRTENELRQSEAQAKKDIAKAAGEAGANRELNASLTPNLIEWRRLQLVDEAIKKWDGRRPLYEGNGGGLLLSVSPSQAMAPAASEPQKK